MASWPTPDVTWDGRAWFAAWDDYGNYTASLKFAAISLRGQVATRGTVTPTGPASSPPSIAPGIPSAQTGACSTMAHSRLSSR